MPKGFGYLKPNVVTELLVDGWYAWAHLIPCPTGARKLAARHSPPITLANPTMPGGLLADQEPRLPAVTNLIIYGGVKSICYSSHAGKTSTSRGITAERPFENKEILLP